MSQSYKTVYKGGEAEIVEKKSRFIAKVFSISSEEEVVQILEEIRKKYWDARHHCYAYSFDGVGEILRQSDDGEPQGTAGKPILEVLTGEKLHNTLIVVIRYFGGTLLGTGGLVRAYQQSSKAGVLASEVITKIPGTLMEIRIEYTDLGKVQYLLAQRGILTPATDYLENVSIKALVPQNMLKAVKDEITEGTGGRAEMEEIKELFFADTSDGVLEFES